MRKVITALCLCVIVESFDYWTMEECLAHQELATSEGSRLECNLDGNHVAYTKLGD